MSANLIVNGPGPIIVEPAGLLHLYHLLDDDEFFEFCRANRDLRIERSSKGDIIIMPPTGGETGTQNFELIGAFWSWVKKDRTGKGFDSSTGFSLPSGAKRSPDLAWVRNERWEKLSDEQRKKFPPLTPDFLVELLSESDSLAMVQDKMSEYIESGAQLCWLIDPFEKRIYVYRPGASVEVLNDPQTISGEPLLEGFVLDVQSLWAAGD